MYPELSPIERIIVDGIPKHLVFSSIGVIIIKYLIEVTDHYAVTERVYQETDPIWLRKSEHFRTCWQR